MLTQLPAPSSRGKADQLQHNVQTVPVATGASLVNAPNPAPPSLATPEAGSIAECTGFPIKEILRDSTGLVHVSTCPREDTGSWRDAGCTEELQRAFPPAGSPSQHSSALGFFFFFC